MVGRPLGRIVATRGVLLEAELAHARVGEGVRVATAGGAVAARIAAVHRERVVLSPFGTPDGIGVDDVVASDRSALALPLGTPLLGRAIDALGAPLDGASPPRGRRVPVEGDAEPIGARRALRDVCWTGVRAIDGPLAFGRGARIGVFGPPGAGKSTLLEAIVAGADADAVVVTLVGERAREAHRWLGRIDRCTTIVCATGDRPAAERLRAAEVGFAQAQALRARGLDVVLVVDSLARICAAARELALATGEPAGRAGYPPSVFAFLARLVEGAGASEAGSVTLVATVLAEGADADDPVSHHARAALDGHLVLSERLARAGRFPALDIPASASRTLHEVASAPHRAAAARLRAALAALEESREPRALGLDVAARDPFLARAIALEPALAAFLRQDVTPSPPERTLTELLALADRLQ